MATSYAKSVTASCVQYTIDEIMDNADYWGIRVVRDDGTFDYELTNSEMIGTNTQIKFDTGKTKALTIPEGVTVTAIGLLYSEDSGTTKKLMYSETGLNEEFPYGGQYIVTGFTITLTAHADQGEI